MNHIDKKILNQNDNDTVHFPNLNYNGPLNKSYEFSPEYVWNHSFVKISFYSTIATTLTVTFGPQYLHRNPTMDSNYIPTFSNSPIVLENQSIDLTAEANNYKHFVLPVTGETVKITLESSNYTSTNHTYLSVCATKLQSAVNNS